MNRFFLLFLRPTKVEYLFSSAAMSLLLFSVLSTIFSQSALTIIALYIVSDTICNLILTRKIYRLKFIDAVSNFCFQYSAAMLIATGSVSLLLKGCIAIFISICIVFLHRKVNRHRILLQIRTLSGFLMIFAIFFL